MNTALNLHNLSTEDFLWFRREVRALAGIGLGDSKRELMQSRLRPRIAALGLSGFSEYRTLLERSPDDSPEWQILVNLITTNKTDFFREMDHFSWLQADFLPVWRRANPAGILRVWSAACSTGEEPYSLALFLHNAFQGQPLFEITASDIDTTALSVAQNGVYRRERVYGVVPPNLIGGVAQGGGEIADWVKIKKHIKERVSFQQINLIDTPYPFGSHFDLIFCRNVFIYFPPEVISTIVRSMQDACRNNACLVIGQSESLQGVEHDWKYLMPSIFQKRRI